MTNIAPDYYCGIAITLESSDIYSPWAIDKINDMKSFIEQERSIARLNASINEKTKDSLAYNIIIATPINEKSEIITEYNSNNILALSVFDRINGCIIEPNTSVIVTLPNIVLYNISKNMNKIASLIERGDIERSINMLPPQLQDEWDKRKEFLKQHNCVYKMKELDYIISKKEEIKTEIEMSEALPEKEPHYNRYYTPRRNNGPRR